MTQSIQKYFLMILLGHMWSTISPPPPPRVIRLTSPYLNPFIVAGALLMYVSVFIGSLPTTDEDVVHAKCIVSGDSSMSACVSMHMCNK